MQPDPANHTCGVMVVVMVRNVYDWAARMKRMCYHCEDIAKLRLNQFLRAPYAPMCWRKSTTDCLECDTGAHAQLVVAWLHAVSRLSFVP